MPKSRRGPKAASYKKRSWTRPARSTSYRKASSRRVMTNSGIKSSIGSAPYKHKFTRHAQTTDLVSYDDAGFQFQSTPTGLSSTLTAGVYLGPTMTDPSGVPNSYMVGGACMFTLSDLPDYSDFTQLFDQYRIDQVDIEISQVQNAASAGNPASQMATLYYCTDFDDATVPTSINTMLEKQRIKKWTFRGDGQPLRISIQPRVSTEVYRSGVTNGYAVSSQATYIDCKNIDVQYYGMKFIFQNLYGSSALVRGESHFKWSMKYHLSFKDPV